MCSRPRAGRRIASSAWTAALGRLSRLTSAPSCGWAPTSWPPHKIDPADASPPAVLGEKAAVQEQNHVATIRDGARSDVRDARVAAVQRGRPAWTPDERISAEQGGSPSTAERIAAEIAADRHRLEDVAAGHVSVHPDVLTHLRQIVTELVNGRPV